MPAANCPRCNKPIKGVSIVGGVFDAPGFSIPQPDDVCITFQPCRCRSCRGDADFAAFLDAAKQALGIP
jgi:hypothetical protein